VTINAEQIADFRAETATTQWQRWSTRMQIIVTGTDWLPAARREVDAELDAVEEAASRFRPDSEINALSSLITGSNQAPTEEWRASRPSSHH
jgi:FAD:protein FMN transferase